MDTLCVTACDTITGTCDSVPIIITVFCTKDINDTITAIVCAGETFNGHLAPGIYVDSFKTAGNCDSVITTILPLDLCGDTIITLCDTCTQTVCLDTLLNFNQGNWTFCDGSSQITTGKGVASIDANGCVTFTATGISGMDTLCVTACDTITGTCDSVPIIITVFCTKDINDTITAIVCAGETFNGHLAPGIYVDSFKTAGNCDSVITTILPLDLCGDTIITLCDTCTQTVCLDTLLNFNQGNWTFCDGSSQITTGKGVASIDANGCVTFTATGISGMDTLCVTACDTITGTCDSVPIIITVLCTKKYNDTISVAVCSVDSTFNGLQAPGVYVDSLLTVGGCDSILTIILTLSPVIDVPDTVFVSCDLSTGLAEFCLPLPFTEFSGYELMIDGEVYFDLPFICDVDTLGGYDFSTAISQGTFGGNNHILLNWDIEGVEQVDVNFSFSTLGELAAYMNGKHAVGNFVSTTDNRIEGGKPGITYGNLRVFSPGVGAVAVVSHNFGILSKGTLIDGLEEGCKNFTLTNKETGCVQEFVVCVVCEEAPKNDTLIIEVGKEDSLITVCLPFGEILQLNGEIDTAFTCGQGDKSTVSISDSNCVSITINEIPFTGTDTLCVIHCSNGVCDTTILILVPEEKETVKTDTLYVPVRKDDIIELCLSSDIIEVPAPYDSVIICREGSQSTLLTSEDTSCVSLVLNAATFLGTDTLCVIHCTDSICDTTIIIPIKVKTDTIITPDTIICLDSVLDWPGLIGSRTIICSENIDTVIFTTDSICNEGVIVTRIDESADGKLCLVHCDTIAGVCDTTIILIPRDSLPIAVDDFATVETGQSIDINILDNDIYGDTIFIMGLLDSNDNYVDNDTRPSGGVFVLNPDGTVTYTRPDNPLFVGVDSIRYVICENGVNVADCGPNDVDTAWIIVFVSGVLSDCNGVLPQAITPNQDGLNDFLNIGCILNKENVELFVYNRWGNEVYRNINYELVNFTTSAWDGTYKGKPLPDGVYYYLLRFNDDSGNKIIATDFVTIIR
jgi:gliding motility-associated-like protein